MIKPKSAVYCINFGLFVFLADIAYNISQEEYAMIQLETLNILSFGGGTPSTTLALMSCQNKLEGQMVYPKVPIYDAIIFCDLNAEPSWVYRQVEFVADACQQADIPCKVLRANLYHNFVEGFGTRRVSSIPFWSVHCKSGKSGKMPRQCTCDYKIKVIERFVRSKLLCYQPRERTKPYDIHAHAMHLGIMADEYHRAKESRQRLFTNQYPLVEMGWTRVDCFAYNKEVWGLETRASSCVFCPFHTTYFFQYLQAYEPDNYAKVQLIDELLENKAVHPPLQSTLFLTKRHVRLRDLDDRDGRDAQTFSYHGRKIWNGF